MLLRFINDNQEEFVIEKHNIIYKNKRYLIKNIGVITNNYGRLCTDEYHIKYSKNELNVYNNDHILLDTFFFTLKQKNPFYQNNEINTNKQNNMYKLTDTCYIQLFLDNGYVMYNNKKIAVFKKYKLGNNIMMILLENKDNVSIKDTTGEVKYNGMSLHKMV